MIVPVWPELSVIGENGAAGLMEVGQKSPVSEVIVGSKALLCAVMASVAVAAGAGAVYGPHSDGTAPQ